MTVYEHNPYSPPTACAVNTRPLAKSTILSRAPAIRVVIEEAGFHKSRVEFHAFLQGPQRALWPLESWLR